MPGHDLQAYLVGRGRFARRSLRASGRALALGQATDYRREKALPASRERRKFDTNPDLQARGAAAHARTQNAVADALERNGLTPITIRGGAACDLAWEWSRVLNVAEVKSLTRTNEERQLRLGLGQVLRYRHLVTSSGMNGQAWLITERAPTDEAWSSLCAELGVQLAWPQVFEARLLDTLRDRVSRTRKPRAGQVPR